MNEELRKAVGTLESIYYEGKPSFKCFIFESIFNPMLIFAFLWGAFDFGFISVFRSVETGMDYFLIPFFLIHLMPVWIYLGGVISTFLRYKNTYYVVTEHAIYVSSGVITKKINSKPFFEMSHIDLHRGFFDQWFNVGDIIATSNHSDSNGTNVSIRIDSISNYDEVYQIVKKLQKDVYSDTMYPNDKRPDENYGYNTKYMG